jgi:hypothetical protein
VLPKITCFWIGWNKACSICADKRKHCSRHPNWEEPPSVTPVNKSHATLEARCNTLPDDSVQLIIVELHAIRKAIAVGFDSLWETFTLLPATYPRLSSFGGGSSRFAHSDCSENAATGPSGTFHNDEEEIEGSFMA